MQTHALDCWMHGWPITCFCWGWNLDIDRAVLNYSLYWSMLANLCPASIYASLRGSMEPLLANLKRRGRHRQEEWLDTVSHASWMHRYSAQSIAGHKCMVRHAPVCYALQHKRCIRVIALLHDQNAMWHTLGPPEQRFASKFTPLVQKAGWSCGFLLVMMLLTCSHCCYHLNLRNKGWLVFGCLSET